MTLTYQELCCTLLNNTAAEERQAQKILLQMEIFINVKTLNKLPFIFQ